MLRPPSLTSAPYFPVTTSICGAAIGLTVMWRPGQNLDFMLMDWHIWDQWQLWRVLTSMFLHVGFFHLAFNLYWTWTFGTLVERVYGHFRFAAIVVLLALGSMLAEYLFLSGGVGLSGVGYGLWGMLYVLETRDGRFANAVDQQTSQTFVIWFFICIATTVTGIMPVANIAHGVGAVLGGLLGHAICDPPHWKWKSILPMSIILAFGLIGSMFFWPWINLSGEAGAEVERAGIAALDRTNDVHAVKVLEIAVGLKHARAGAWYNLGVAYVRTGNYAAANRAFKHAAEMPDADQQIRAVGQVMGSFEYKPDTNR
jgi:membrane associated rhomboid family serine protease